MKVKRLLWLILVFVLVMVLFFLVRPVHGLAEGADEELQAAAMGAILAPEGETMVQMISAEIDVNVRDEERWNVGRTIWRPVAAVSERFLLVNRGEVDEVVQVQFPLDLAGFVGDGDAVDGLGYVAVFVDGEMVSWDEREMGRDFGTGDATMTRWAVFEVEFDVGEVVEIVVQFEQPAMVMGKRGVFSFLMEMGAGWFDVIEEADVRMRLPFEVSGFTVAEMENLPEGSTVMGKELRWHFVDWTPSGADDLDVMMLRPSVFGEIRRAQELVANDAVYENLWVLAMAYYEMGLDQWGVMDDGWEEYVPVLETVLALMDEMKPEDEAVEVLYAVALAWHVEMDLVAEGYALPVSVALIDDVMFGLREKDGDDLSELEEDVMSQLEWYYRFYLTEPEEYFEGYAPKGVAMGAPVADGLALVTDFEAWLAAGE